MKEITDLLSKLKAQRNKLNKTIQALEEATSIASDHRASPRKTTKKVCLQCESNYKGLGGTRNKYCSAACRKQFWQENKEAAKKIIADKKGVTLIKGDNTKAGVSH